jgi:hypothetical protein
MALIITITMLCVIISGYIYKLIKSAPLKYLDEKRFIDAVKYEERYSDIYENDFEKFSKKTKSTRLKPQTY